MSDVHTPEQRSYNMSRISSKNTKPEMIVRRIVHGLGYRYRLHRKDLPGKPDLVFPSRRKIILVHGCFFICTIAATVRLFRKQILNSGKINVIQMPSATERMKQNLKF